MTSMSKEKGGVSSSNRLQSQLTSSSLGLTPPLGASGDISDMFAGVMNELRRDMFKRIDLVHERAHRGRENLRDELTHVRSQARVDLAQLIRNIDQCLAESLAHTNKESEERQARMTREIERLLNDHDNTYAHTITSLEERLDAKSDLTMLKLDNILNGSNREERSNPWRGPSKFEIKLRIEEQRAAKGSPVKAWLDESSPTGGRCYSGDKVANCATSQFSARSDNGLT